MNFTTSIIRLTKYENKDFIPEALISEILRNEDVNCIDELYLQETINKYEEVKNKLDKLSEQDASYCSLFKHYLFTECKNKRTYISKNFIKCRDTEVKVYSKDFWTQGIYFELAGMKFEECYWSNLIQLPDEYKKTLLI